MRPAPNKSPRRAGRAGRVLALLVLSLLLSGCRPAPPVHLTAVWADGQTATYDLLDAGGHVTGTASSTWHRDKAGWKLVHRRDETHQPATA